MHRKFWLGVALFLLPVVFFGSGCSSSGGGSSGNSASCGGLGSQGIQGTVDMAVGENDNQIIALFLDILAKPDTAGNPDSTIPEADVTLDNAGSGISDPKSIAFTDSDLYVGNRGNNTVRIFRDYQSLADNAAPDAILDNATAGISQPYDMLVDGDDNLIVVDLSAQRVSIFRDASAITATQAPDIILNAAGSLINNPVSVAVNEGNLIVANLSAGAGLPRVMIYDDISTLASSDAPDVSLNEDTSFFGLGDPVFKITTSADTLFAGVGDTSAGEQAVYIFRDLTGLSDDALPDTILFGAETHMDTPAALEYLTGLDTLVVGNANFNQFECTDAGGLAAFSDVANAATGNPATAVLSQDASNIGSVFTLRQAGGALFVAAYANNCDYYPGNIYIFRNVQSLNLCSGSQPNIIIPGSGVTGLDYGPFSTVNRWNALAVHQRAQGL